MRKFDSELRMALTKRLPNRLDYVVSYRIEGAVELREMTTGHDRVVIIIDCETDAKTIAPILDALVRFIKRDNYFWLSYYSVFLWRDETFSPLSPRVCRHRDLGSTLKKSMHTETRAEAGKTLRRYISPTKM